jgi:tetrahydromethanopterin S-methyltransferase subunit D
MNPVTGLLGAFVFAIGGAIVFYQLTNVLGRNYTYSQTSGNFVAFLVGFLFIGLVLWLIALTARPDIKQNPS